MTNRTDYRIMPYSSGIEDNGFQPGQSKRKWNITTPIEQHFVCETYGVKGMSPETCLKRQRAREYSGPKFIFCAECEQGAEIREKYPEKWEGGR